MTPAPVGFHCPECIAEGAKSVPQPKTVLGGQKRQEGQLLTMILIAVNVVVFIGGLIIGQSGLPADIAFYSGVSYVAYNFGLLEGASGFIGVADGEWYRLLTAAFVHEEFLHIGFNMLALWLIGRTLEPVLGRSRFAALYFLSALGGSAASLLSDSLSIGASGAVYGLFGALFVVMRRLGGDVSFLLVVLGFNLVYSFAASGIDWRAHLGGLVVGVALGYAFSHAPKEHRDRWGVVACAVMFVVVAGMTMFALA